MKYNDFDPNRFAKGRKHALELDLEPAASGVRLPVLLVRGNVPGKTLVATAGIHGDEYEGVRAIFDVYAALDPAEMSGDFLAVPIANPPAFWAGTRTSPLDGENLARIFPGSQEAGPSAAIAYALAQSILSRADLFLDLHSAGVKLLMPAMVGYDALDDRSRAAALAFGAPTLWAHSQVPPGRTVSFARAHGIPWLYTEARGAGRIHPDDLRMFTQGIENLLHHLAILPGNSRKRPVEIHLSGDGDIDGSLTAKRQGILIPSVELLQRVRAGEPLGRTIDFQGETLETYYAPCEGAVVLIQQCLAVKPGDGVFLITGLDAQDIEPAPASSAV
jgi:uncharacterized protein